MFSKDFTIKCMVLQEEIYMFRQGICGELFIFTLKIVAIVLFLLYLKLSDSRKTFFQSSADISNTLKVSHLNTVTSDKVMNAALAGTHQMSL